MKHQAICNRIAHLFKRFAYFLDTGVGKTLTALSIISDFKKIKWVVVCPKALTKTAWLEDAQKFFPDIKCIPVSKNMKKTDYADILDSWGVEVRRTAKDTLRKYALEMADVIIINPESFKGEYPAYLDLGYNGLIVDESTTIKNPSSQISKDIAHFADQMERVYILTGKPAPKNQMDYFGQIRIVDKSAFGASFFRFKTDYFVQGGFGGYEWYPKENCDNLIANKIKDCSIVISKEQCLDLPSKSYERRMVDLGGVYAEYKELEKDMVLALKSGDTLSVTTKTGLLMKLRQFAGGFIYNEGIPVRVHNKKASELSALLDEIGQHKVIIWIQFKEEVEIVEEVLQKKRAKYCTAYSGTRDVDESIRAFKHDEDMQYIIAHPATLKFGVTFTACTYAVYYSQSYDYEEYYQSHDRIYRKGQVNPCTFIFLQCEGTVDEIMYKALGKKGDLSSVIEDLIR
jgi:SNF2 family DNA or RNA helicase